MKYISFLIFLAPGFPVTMAAQVPVTHYTQHAYMIPARDGTKLYTVVWTPEGNSTRLPLLIQRTPYGADHGEGYDPTREPYIANMAAAGYLFVFQDIRGKFKSEGHFEMNRPLYHLQSTEKTDESTDTWDTVDWLVKNIPNNNGKAGIFGISYLGYTALDAISNPHPALKASSPQASPADMFLGDDFHHNGAFRLSYGFEYSYMVENEKESNSSYPFPQFDLYNWYLKLGPLSNVNEKYYHNRIPAWNDFVEHPNYDNYWQKSSMLNQVKYPSIPTLHVGGYYDQEDLNGPQIMYAHLEKKDSSNRNFLVLGPWYHGGWAGPNGDSLGKISFGSKTAAHFQDLQKAWFDYWLKGMGDGLFAEATCFQTGSNEWKSYTHWPPASTTIKRFYVHPDGSAGFNAPASASGAVSYVSDPAHPVPYRNQPVEYTYGRGSRWRYWQVEDQRFVDTRPDVLSFVADSASSDLTVTGDVKAHLFISTTGTDADFVVKLIDVYPDIDSHNLLMSGYQFPVTMEVFRGRFRNSFSAPEPFVPGKPAEIILDLHNINHVFLRGHKIMVQIQSSWFPLIDRNPQHFVPNIFTAKASDYIKATETIYCNRQLATCLELPVVE